MLQRLFSGFPGGWPGVALLLLRVALAVTLLVQSGYYLSDLASAGTWFAGVAGVIAGALLLVGFLTPVAGAIVGLCAIGAGLSLIPIATRTLFPSIVPAVLAVTILFAVIVLGPGAFSIDARVFGRREIIFPRNPSQRR